MEQEVKMTAEQQAIDDSYMYHRERKAAMADLRELERQRDERHQQEAEWDKTHKCGPIARWWINWKRHWKDVADEEREEELWNIASPVMAFNRWVKKKNVTK